MDRADGSRPHGARARVWGAVALAAWLSAPAPAAAQPAAAPPPPRAAPDAGATPARAGRFDRATVQAALEAEPNRPVNATLARELGPEADRALIVIASDESAAAALRVRAVTALGLLRTPMADSYLRKVVRSIDKAQTPLDRQMVRQAALGLAWSPAADTPAMLGPLLYHPDRDVRIDAAVALAVTRLPDAIPLLEDRLEREQDTAARRQIARQLRTLRDAVTSQPRRRPADPGRKETPPPGPNTPRPYIGGRPTGP